MRHITEYRFYLNYLGQTYNCIIQRVHKLNLKVVLKYKKNIQFVCKTLCHVFHYNRNRIVEFP